LRSERPAIGVAIFYFGNSVFWHASYGLDRNRSDVGYFAGISSSTASESLPRLMPCRTDLISPSISPGNVLTDRAAHYGGPDFERELRKGK
jgi:hypothetical protein